MSDSLWFTCLSTLQTSLPPLPPAPSAKKKGLTAVTSLVDAGAGSGSAGPSHVLTGIAYARGSLDVGVAWNWCCVCQSAAPATTCRTCGDVFCEPCYAVVHRGRMAAHASLPGVVPDALPAPNLAAQTVRDAEAEWVATQRRSYVTAAKESWASVKHYWALWFTSFVKGPLDPQDVAAGNPEV